MERALRFSISDLRFAIAGTSQNRQFKIQNRKSRRRTAAEAAAFSLLELLVVMAFMVLLLALAVPAVNTTLDGSQLQRSGFTIADILHQARQAAVARNAPVEVRIYAVPVDGETRWSGFQIWAVDAAGGSSEVPLSRMTRLGDSVALHPVFSPILEAGGLSGTQPLPGYQGGIDYRGVRFRPDGSLDALVGADANYLTIINARYFDAEAEAPPANFLTVQINPYTGTPVIYQP